MCFFSNKRTGINDRRHGKGEFISIKGWKYNGDWKNDKKEVKYRNKL
jgi:hypothetical protein